MMIHSPDFLRKKPIPSKFTCDGVNVHPTLLFSDVPVGAKSLAIIMDDIDSPSKIWVHWTIWNIPPVTQEIPEGTIPPGAVEGITDFESIGYGGPCPGTGEHRYIFRLYALDAILGLPRGAKREELEEAIKGHLIAQTELMGVYQRIENPS